MGMAATRRTRASSGNNVLLLLAIGLVFSAASTTTPAVAAAALNGSDDDIGAAARAAGLSVDFHAASCPDLDGIVRSAVEEARRWDAQVTAGLLRIFFHDCFPQGCDASILLGRNQGGSEQDAPQNTGLQQAALDLVERIRGRVHSRCGASVSCADILALATSHAVNQAGGPFIPMELGRSDSRGPAPGWAVNRLPPPTDGVSELLGNFGNRGLDGSDVVVLSGAHTVGVARCSSFQDRIDKKTGKDNFEWGLTGYCNGDKEKKHALDRTPFNFDNSYFVELQNGRGVLTSDQALYRDGRTRWLVDRCASSQDEFFKRFVESMLKLSRLRGADPGPVRNNCFVRASFGASSATKDDLVIDTTAGDGDGDEDLILAAAA
ncbi:peroxidase 12 precursor [Zea mays]|jgi:peroxidase|uniref:Peroxidase n=1 Tax=Zea mays TaxID=4577 RepID=B4FG25_MAIZE|nr:peroxidase 12 precursor [Zea mays]ACF81068.1 unknown [Zea mays]ACG34684.1 peroxidase 12 precursor [Zea mays]AQK47448.1 Peroxidase 12 [Zea mays]|eukprot:NP_001132283.1 peroxidase 12 precursor [Zea mays]